MAMGGWCNLSVHWFCSSPFPLPVCIRSDLPLLKKRGVVVHVNLGGRIYSQVVHVSRYNRVELFTCVCSRCRPCTAAVLLWISSPIVSGVAVFWNRMVRTRNFLPSKQTGWWPVLEWQYHISFSRHAWFGQLRLVCERRLAFCLSCPLLLHCQHSVLRNVLLVREDGPLRCRRLGFQAVHWAVLFIAESRGYSVRGSSYKDCCRGTTSRTIW